MCHPTRESQLEKGQAWHLNAICHISTNGSGWRCKILCIPLRKNPFHNGFLRKKTTKLNQQIALEQIFHTYQSYDIVDWQQLLLSGSFESDQILPVVFPLPSSWWSQISRTRRGTRPHQHSQECYFEMTYRCKPRFCGGRTRVAAYTKD